MSKKSNLPNDAEAYTNKGFVKCIIHGDHNTAIVCYNRALEADPDYAEAYFLRGFANLMLGKCKDAIADFDQAIVRKDRYADAHFFRGAAKSALDEHEGAGEDRNRAIELNPALKDADFEAWARLGQSATTCPPAPPPDSAPRHPLPLFRPPEQRPRGE